MDSKGIKEEDKDVIAIAIKQEQARKDQKPWPITTEEAAEFAAQVFGLTGIDVSKVKEFVSYDDRNYFLPSVSYLNAQTNVSETLDVIFKVHNGVESENEPLIRAHNYVLSQVFQSGVNVPEPLPIKTGADTIGWIDLKLIRDPSNTRKHAVRLLRFIPGVIIDQSEEESPELLKHLGSFVGKMDRILLQLPEVPKGLEERILLWDLKNVPALSRFSECIIDLDNRALQQKVIARFNELVAPKIGTLRKAVIQNDANEQNIVIDESRRCVTGILDFGDCVHTCLIFELAICIAYIMLGKKDPLATAAHIYKGYVGEVELSKDELRMLPCLVASRLVQSVTMGAYSHSKDPTNDYLLLTSKTGWNAIRVVTGMSEEDFLLALQK